MFFTIATILGALWAADAWGRYWSWDPKETWAFIVWLNYAVWLHLRLVAGWRGKVLAWWAIIGLFITAFAFIGVNMFLSGLHSYGALSNCQECCIFKQFEHSKLKLRLEMFFQPNIHKKYDNIAIY